MTLSDPRNNAGSFKPVVAGQRVYVWILTSCTILLAALAAWPMTVKQFQSTSTFRIQYDPSASLNKVDVSRLVLESVRDLLDSDAFEQILDEIEIKHDLESDLLAKRDSYLVQESLRIQSRPGDSSNSVEFRCTLVGDGTQDEVFFVNALVSHVIGRLAADSLHDSATSAIDQLASDFEDYHLSMTASNQEIIQSTIHQISTVHHDFQILANDLATMTPSNGQVTAQNLDPRWTELADQIERLKAEKRRLINEGQSSFHPTVINLQEQIESLSLRQSQLPKFQAGGGAGGNGTSVIENKFISQSNSMPLSVSMTGVIDQIKAIDLSTPRDQLHDAYQQLENDKNSTNTISERLKGKAVSALVGESSLAINRLDLGRKSLPVGGAPTRKSFLLLLFSSAAVATVITLHFDPSMRKRHFRNAQQLENTLTLPVVGQFPMRQHVHKARPFAQRFSMIAVRACEWILLGFLAVFIVAALVNSEVISAMVENPFDAVTRIVWMIAPQN